LAGETVICNAPTVKLGVTKLFAMHAGFTHAAQELLGLAEDEIAIFNGKAEGWIEPFHHQFQNAKTYKGEARAAVNYLKHILATGNVIE
jgi:hypothetical protein